MLIEFRKRYPQGSLVSELVTVDHGKYVVKASVIVAQITLATGLAAAETIETAEDRARARALAVMALEFNQQHSSARQTVVPAQSEAAATMKTTIANGNLPQPSLTEEVTTEATTEASMSKPVVADEVEAGKGLSLGETAKTSTSRSTVSGSGVLSGRQTARECRDRSTLNSSAQVKTTPTPSWETYAAAESYSEPAVVETELSATELTSSIFDRVEASEESWGEVASSLDEPISTVSERSTFEPLPTSPSTTSAPPILESNPSAESSDTKLRSDIASSQAKAEKDIEMEEQKNVASVKANQHELTDSVNYTPIELDFNEIKHKTDVELKRLGWTKEQGRDFLLKTYGKRSRLHLTDEEFLNFLHYLESQPTP